MMWASTPPARSATRSRRPTSSASPTADCATTRRHWELDDTGQPTQQIIESRRRAAFITPIPKPKKHKKAAAQETFVFDEGKGLSIKEQEYDTTSIINEVRHYVGAWRSLPS